jgi:hypothetical protein
MTSRARSTIAVLVTALFVGAMSAAGALTHSHGTSVTTIGHAPSAAVSARPAIPSPDSESMTND